MLKRLILAASVVCSLPGQDLIYQDQDGWAVVEGDILLGKVAEIGQTTPEISSKSAVRHAIGRTSARARWPEGVVPYAISEEIPNAKRILDAVEHWNQNTPVRLVERTTETNYIKFVRASSATTCNSFVGMVGRDQAVNLGDQCSAGNTIHEIGHAVGLFHEQSRQDRDLFLRTILENADKRTLTNFSQQLIESDDIGPYDHTSIMHYDLFGFSRNGLPVLETIPPGIPVSQRERLSPADIASVRKMYGWPVDTVTISTNPFGLQIVVDGEVYTSPATFKWQAGSRHTISANEAYENGGYRYVFHDWNDGGDREHSLTVAADMPVYSANFIRYAQLTIGTNGSGSITAEPKSLDGYYPEGSVVELRATPEEGSQFGGWSGFIFTSHGLSQNPLRITLRAPSLRYTANFTNAPLTVVTSEPTGLRVVVDGTTITTPRNYVWLPESRHELKVETETQDGGFETYRNVFRGWSDEGGISHTVTAGRESQVFTARFQTQYLVARGSTTGGTLEFNPAFSDGYYDQGTALQIVPTATGANRFVSWNGDATGSDAPGQLMVDDHKLVGATFQTPRAITSLVNAATRINLGAIAAGEMVIIRGLEIGPESGDISNVRVTFDQARANVIRAGLHEITVVGPESLAGKTLAVMTVSVDGIPARSVQVTVLPATPGIFTADDSGKGQAKAWNEDGSENNNGNPAPKGSVILVMATSVKNGSDPLTARVAGRDAVVQSVSTDDSGVAQVRIRLPKECPSGQVPVVIRAGDASSLGTASVAVRQP